MRSEEIIVESPTSFTGSAKRIWRITDRDVSPYITVPIAVVCIVTAWLLVLVWYAICMLLLVVFVPFRLIRRSARKRKVEEARHREMLAAMNDKTP